MTKGRANLKLVYSASETSREEDVQSSIPTIGELFEVRDGVRVFKPAVVSAIFAALENYAVVPVADDPLHVELVTLASSTNVSALEWVALINRNHSVLAVYWMLSERLPKKFLRAVPPGQEENFTRISDDYGLLCAATEQPSIVQNANESLDPLGPTSPQQAEESPPSSDRPPPARVRRLHRCEIGKVYSGFRVESLIAKGGMGEVYRALHLASNREVAFKILGDEYLSRSDVQTRFRMEARALGQVRHWSVVRIYHADDDRELGFYIAMELLSGKTLQQVMDWEGRMPVSKALPLMRRIATATHHLHGHKLIHRDLKPDNIFLERDEAEGIIPKLLDLGTATGAGVQKITGQYAWATAQYMSPEHARGADVVPASDVYSLGIILYQMLTGRLPYGADHPAPTDAHYRNWHMIAEPDPINEVSPGIPSVIANVVHRALSKDLSERFMTAEAFAYALEAAALRYESDHPTRPDVTPVPHPVTAPVRVPGPKRAAASRLRLDDEAAVERAYECTKLAESNGPSARHQLHVALGDTHATVRTAAALALGRCGDARSITALERAIERESSGWLVEHFEKAIADIRERRAPHSERAKARLVTKEGVKFPLRRERITIGRSADADVFIDHSTVSWSHAYMLSFGDGTFEVCDTKSTNGVYVNGTKIVSEIVRDGDMLDLGDVRVRLEVTFGSEDEDDDLPLSAPPSREAVEAVVGAVARVQPPLAMPASSLPWSAPKSAPKHASADDARQFFRQAPLWLWTAPFASAVLAVGLWLLLSRWASTEHATAAKTGVKESAAANASSSAGRSLPSPIASVSSSATAAPALSKAAPSTTPQPLPSPPRYVATAFPRARSTPTAKPSSIDPQMPTTLPF